jgi:hypothetical protein
MKLNCSKCHQEMNAGLRDIGKFVKCQNCGAKTIIPARIVSKRQPKSLPITCKKAIRIGFFTGIAISVIGLLLILSPMRRDPLSTMQTIGGFIIELELRILLLLGKYCPESARILIIFIIGGIIMTGVICAIIGYLLILMRHKFKWEKEYSIPFFALKIIVIHIILNSIFFKITFWFYHLK